MRPTKQQVWPSYCSLFLCVPLSFGKTNPHRQSGGLLDVAVGSVQLVDVDKTTIAAFSLFDCTAPTNNQFLVNEHESCNMQLLATLMLLRRQNEVAKS